MVYVEFVGVCVCFFRIGIAFTGLFEVENNGVFVGWFAGSGVLAAYSSHAQISYNWLPGEDAMGRREGSYAGTKTAP